MGLNRLDKIPVCRDQSNSLSPSKAFAFEGFCFILTVGGARIPGGSAPFPSDAPGSTRHA